MLLFKLLSRTQMSWIREGELSFLERLSANILKVTFFYFFFFFFFSCIILQLLVV